MSEWTTKLSGPAIVPDTRQTRITVFRLVDGECRHETLPVIAWAVESFYDRDLDIWTSSALPISVDKLPEVWCLNGPQIHGYVFPYRCTVLTLEEAVADAKKQLDEG